MRARTGLWEPWVSNHPGPPGPNAVRHRFDYIFTDRILAPTIRGQAKSRTTRIRDDWQSQSMRTVLLPTPFLSSPSASAVTVSRWPTYIDNECPSEAFLHPSTQYEVFQRHPLKLRGQHISRCAARC